MQLHIDSEIPSNIAIASSMQQVNIQERSHRVRLTDCNTNLPLGPSVLGSRHNEADDAIPVKVPANPNRRLRNREKLGGLAGSYRHAWGVYAISRRSLCQGDGETEVLADKIEGDVGGSLHEWSRSGACGSCMTEFPSLLDVIIKQTLTD